jgi:hypothetical protein
MSFEVQPEPRRLKRVGDQRHYLAVSPPRMKTCTHGVGGWVDYMASLDGSGEEVRSCPHNGIRAPDRPARSESQQQKRYAESDISSTSVTFALTYFNFRRYKWQQHSLKKNRQLSFLGKVICWLSTVPTKYLPCNSSVRTEICWIVYDIK